MVKAVHNQMNATRLSRVFLQLDSYITAQFCGVCVGIQNGLFKKKGIHVEFMDACAPGEEVEHVLRKNRALKEAERSTTDAVLGTLEQYVLAEKLLVTNKHENQVKAIGAMFGSSPLSLATCLSNT